MDKHGQITCDEEAKALMECQEATSEGDYTPSDDNCEAPSKHAPMRIASAPG